MAGGLDQYVLGFEVSVNNAGVMEVLERRECLRQVKPDRGLREDTVREAVAEDVEIGSRAEGERIREEERSVEGGDEGREKWVGAKR